MYTLKHEYMHAKELQSPWFVCLGVFLEVVRFKQILFALDKLELLYTPPFTSLPPRWRNSTQAMWHCGKLLALKDRQTWVRILFSVALCPWKLLCHLSDSRCSSSGNENELPTVLAFERIEGMCDECLAPNTPTRNASAAPDSREQVIRPSLPLLASLILLVLASAWFSDMDSRESSTASVQGPVKSNCWYLDMGLLALVMVFISCCLCCSRPNTLFILGPILALIESDKGQPVRMQVTMFWRSVESSSQGSKLVLKMLRVRVGKPPSICVLSWGDVCFCPAVQDASERPPEPYETLSQEEVVSQSRPRTWY